MEIQLGHYGKYMKYKLSLRSIKIKYTTVFLPHWANKCSFGEQNIKAFADPKLHGMSTYMNMKAKIHLQQLFWISQANLISKEHQYF